MCHSGLFYENIIVGVCVKLRYIFISIVTDMRGGHVHREQRRLTLTLHYSVHDFIDDPYA